MNTLDYYLVSKYPKMYESFAFSTNQIDTHTV